MNARGKKVGEFSCLVSKQLLFHDLALNSAGHLSELTLCSAVYFWEKTHLILKHQIQMVVHINGWSPCATFPRSQTFEQLLPSPQRKWCSLALLPCRWTSEDSKYSSLQYLSVYKHKSTSRLETLAHVDADTALKYDISGDNCLTPCRSRVDGFSSLQSALIEYNSMVINQL